MPHMWFISSEFLLGFFCMLSHYIVIISAFAKVNIEDLALPLLSIRASSQCHVCDSIQRYYL